MFFLYRWALSELHSSLISSMEDLTHACACVVIFWWFVYVSVKSKFEGEMDGDCFVSSGKLFHALIVGEKKEL